MENLKKTGKNKYKSKTIYPKNQETFKSSNSKKRLIKKDCKACN